MSAGALSDAKIVESWGTNADAWTAAVRQRRIESRELVTDRACQPIVENLGEDLTELIEILRPWGRAVQEAGGYPGHGPHDLARVSRPSP